MPENLRSLSETAVIILLILLNARQNLRQYRYAGVLEQLLPLRSDPAVTILIPRRRPVLSHQRRTSQSTAFSRSCPEQSCSARRSYVRCSRGRLCAVRHFPAEDPGRLIRTWRNPPPTVSATVSAHGSTYPSSQVGSSRYSSWICCHGSSRSPRHSVHIRSQVTSQGNVKGRCVLY